ncbi:16S rRNA (guanine(966)-N(2))-methyltransferase RsmD [Thiovibrio sp. JS02]
MRIIAGSARGRKLQAPGDRFGKLIRPTSDRAREALFSILGSRVVGAKVLDLFAGTGALGLEALSRGASQAVFVDGHREVVGLIGKNIALCGFSERALVLRRDLRKGLAFLALGLAPAGFDLVFLDPPYGKKLGHELLAALSGGEHLAAEAIVVVEDGAGEQYPDQAGSLCCYDRRRYGEACFWLYRTQEAEISE